MDRPNLQKSDSRAALIYRYSAWPIATEQSITIKTTREEERADYAPKTIDLNLLWFLRRAG